MDTTATILDAPVSDEHTQQTRFSAMVLGAIGVVFGDIGTSPLYTIKEAFSPHYGLAPDHATVLGIALFFGDGVLTPAISVLSAVEGLQVAAPQLHQWVIPMTLGVLVALF